MPMDKVEAIAVLDEALSKIPSLRQGRLRSPDHVAFIQSTSLELARIFGPDSPISRNFIRISYSAAGSILTNYFDYEVDLARVRHEAFLGGLDMAEGVLRSARAQ